MPSQRITPGTSTLVIRLVDHELSDDGDDGGDVGDRGGGHGRVSQLVMLKVFLVVIVVIMVATVRVMKMPAMIMIYSSGMLGGKMAACTNA